MKNILINLILFFCIMAAIYFGHIIYDIKNNIYNSEIIEQEVRVETTSDGKEYIYQKLNVKLYSQGELKNGTYIVENIFKSGQNNEESLYSVGDKIRVLLILDEAGKIYMTDIFGIVGYGYIVWSALLLILVFFISSFRQKIERLNGSKKAGGLLI